MDVLHTANNNNTPLTRLVQPHHNSDKPIPRFFGVLCSLWKKDKDFARDLKSRASENAMPMVPLQVNTSTLTSQVGLLWPPSGAWKWTAGLSIRGCSNIVNLSSSPKKSVRTYFGTGTIGTQEIEYICKQWHRKLDMPDLVNEMSLYNGQLAPLQGIYVPNIIGIYSGVQSGVDVVNVLMELAHPTFWMHASDDMPDVLKKRCIECFERIHAAGVLYGKVQLSNIIVGGDARVTLVDFQHAAVLEPLPESCQKKTTPDKLRLEMRQVKYLLNYDDARHKEDQKWISVKMRKWWNASELLRAKKERGYTPEYLGEPEEDKLDPPVNASRTKGWIDSKHKTARFVVPTTTTEIFDNAVEKFISNIHRLEDESDGLPQSPRASPTPTLQPSFSHIPDLSVFSAFQSPAETSTPRSKAPPRRSARKRKSEEDNDIEKPLAKRSKKSEEPHPPEPMSPPRSKPIRLRDFVIGSSKVPLKPRVNTTRMAIDSLPQPPSDVHVRDYAFEPPSAPSPLPSALRAIPQNFPSPSAVMEPRPTIAKRLKRPSAKALGKRKRVDDEEHVAARAPVRASTPALVRASTPALVRAPTPAPIRAHVRLPVRAPTPAPVRPPVRPPPPPPPPPLLSPLLIPKDGNFERPSKRLRLDPERLTPPPSPDGRHVSFAPAPEVHIKSYTIPPEMLTPARFKYRRGGRWRSQLKWVPTPERFSISPPLGLRFVSRWVTDFLRPMHL